MTTEWTFDVTGTHCASCGLLIDEVVEELDGVHRSASDVDRHRTVVTADPGPGLTPAAVVAAIAELGYHASLVT